MILAFELSMPSAGAWNGKWSGENDCYMRTVNLGRTKKADIKGSEIISGGPYSYAWDDGWRASVSVKQVTAVEARKIRAKTKGFCGYDWMIDSIRVRGKILASHEVGDELA